jgi:hypothetical protein
LIFKTGQSVAGLFFFMCADQLNAVFWWHRTGDADIE